MFTDKGKTECLTKSECINRIAAPNKANVIVEDDLALRVCSNEEETGFSVSKTNVYYGSVYDHL